MDGWWQLPPDLMAVQLGKVRAPGLQLRVASVRRVALALDQQSQGLGNQGAENGENLDFPERESSTILGTWNAMLARKSGWSPACTSHLRGARGAGHRSGELRGSGIATEKTP